MFFYSKKKSIVNACDLLVFMFYCSCMRLLSCLPRAVISSYAGDVVVSPTDRSCSSRWFTRPFRWRHYRCDATHGWRAALSHHQSRTL